MARHRRCGRAARTKPYRGPRWPRARVSSPAGARTSAAARPRSPRPYRHTRRRARAGSSVAAPRELTAPRRPPPAFPRAPRRAPPPRPAGRRLRTPSAGPRRTPALPRAPRLGPAAATSASPRPRPRRVDGSAVPHRPLSWPPTGCRTPARWTPPPRLNAVAGTQHALGRPNIASPARRPGRCKVGRPTR
nr:uncharacterized protein LOC127324187 [Lolium perenne]